MTHEQFDLMRLPRRLTFIESESARRVLVVGESIEQAAALYKLDIDKLKAILKMIDESMTKYNR